MLQGAGLTLKKALTIKELPVGERPRERLAELGARTLSEAELLAIVIGSGSGGQSALDVAKSILAHAGGSLRNIAREPVAALMATRGVGPACATRVHAAIELGRRMALESREARPQLITAYDVYRWYRDRLQDLPVEEVHAAALDTQCRLICDITVTRGTLNSSLVHAREIFADAIAVRAATVTLIHNHPSGDPEPSPQDMEQTSALMAVGRLIGIELRDHVIIGHQRYVSVLDRYNKPTTEVM
jgi:DNA repair protein RadC